MKARIIAPNGNFSGNLLWRKAELPGKEALVNESLKAISAIGYWTSPFPEGDGVTFRPNDGKDDRTVEQMLADFQAAFPWLDISASPPGTGNLALAELEAQADSPSTERCTVIVPVLKLHFEESLDLGPFRLVCARQFDPSPNERLSNLQGSYLQFDIDILYADLLRLTRHVSDGDVVILQCLARAEQALDVIRFGSSSFKRPEYTPNPAGQLESGFYAAEIIPIGKTHLRPIDLAFPGRCPLPTTGSAPKSTTRSSEADPTSKKSCTADPTNSHWLSKVRCDLFARRSTAWGMNPDSLHWCSHWMASRIPTRTSRAQTIAPTLQP